MEPTVRPLRTHELRSASRLLVGVAAWAPPEVAAIGRSHFLVRFASFEVRALFPRAAPRLLAGFAELGEHHPPERHCYLAFVGIDPRQQRRGLGRTLLAPIIERADDAGIACYLETPFSKTRVFYRRLGFEDADELHPVAGAPTIWTMTRPAASHRAG